MRRVPWRPVYTGSNDPVQADIMHPGFYGMGAMKNQELRAEARIAVRQRGDLKAQVEWFPCLVHDMSGGGFLLMCSRDVEVGQVLDFRCELFPEKRLECRIEVRHVSDAGVGTKIVEIDERGSKLCELFLQEQFSVRLNKSG